MPWKEVSAVELREEFVMLALAEGSNIRALCRRYCISPTTGYKWLARHEAEGRAGLHDRSRRPEHSPGHTPGTMSIKFTAYDSGKPHTAFTFGGAGLNFSGVDRTNMYIESVKRARAMGDIEVSIPNHAGMGQVFERGVDPLHRQDC